MSCHMPVAISNYFRLLLIIIFDIANVRVHIYICEKSIERRVDLGKDNVDWGKCNVDLSKSM